MNIHPLADVQTQYIGKGSRIWQYAVILKEAKIGSNCNINCHTFIENDVIIGDNVTVKPGVFLWDGIHVEDNVFIGPNATFTNDKYPRSKQPFALQKTRLSKFCSIGANATILGGIVVGEYAIVAAGSVVTKDVPAYSLMIGNPAKVVAWLDKRGNKLIQIGDKEYMDQENFKYVVVEGKLIKQ